MAGPIEIDIPHDKGKAIARQKVEAGFDQLTGFLPGGRVTEKRWDGDSLFLAIEGMGQRVAARLDILDQKVHAEVDLPPALALFASKARAALANAGAKLLS